MVPYLSGVDVLITGRVLQHGRDMDAPLVGKSARANIGQMIIMGQIGQLGHIAGGL